MALTKTIPDIQPFEVRRSSIQGRGGYATRAIPKGARIGEYVGERISHRESDRRYDDEAMGRHHTFLFTVTSRTVIDAAVGGNDTRFINHSCAGNCEAVIEDGRVFIDAVRAIPAGSELTYDYAYEREPDAGPADEAVYPCHCGSTKCRGTILAPPKRKRRTPKRRPPKRRPPKRRTRKRRQTRVTPARPGARTGARGSKRRASTPATRRRSKTGPSRRAKPRTRAHRG